MTPSIFPIDNGPKLLTRVDDAFGVISERRQPDDARVLTTVFAAVLTQSLHRERAVVSVGDGIKMLWTSPVQLADLVIVGDGVDALIAGRGVGNRLMAWRATNDFRSVVPLDSSGVKDGKIKRIFRFGGALGVLNENGIYKVEDRGSLKLDVRSLIQGEYFQAAAAVGLNDRFLFVVPAKVMVQNEIEMRSLTNGEVLWRENVGFGKSVTLLHAAALPSHQAVALLYKSKQSLQYAEVIAFTEEGDILGRKAVKWEMELAGGDGKDRFVLFDDSTITTIKLTR